MIKKAFLLSTLLCSAAMSEEPLRDEAQISCFFYYMERESGWAKGERGINHWSYAAYELCYEIESRRAAGIPLNDNMIAARQVLENFEQSVYNDRSQDTSPMGYYRPSPQRKRELAEQVGLFAVLEAFEDGWE